MRTVMSVMFLVLFCSVQLASSASIAIDLAQSKCCFKFSDVKIPVKQVESYFWTSSSCARRAIVFQMKSGKQICVDPDTTWVSGHVDKVDKRTTSTITTTKAQESKRTYAVSI
ncbi:C-C motif chemokine 4-like isoform X1 [Puntigrus tetrazona]|uniref:C-C motif chemokine 4-like isoform X1 n=1 Tax=Puntigrus tetrazona TaxID=1606681 RepID=UPI001C898C11|nr:C-C motif chemokine 4-like isoform X1 [Puntigrus tetrazona]